MFCAKYYFIQQQIFLPNFFLIKQTTQFMKKI